MTFLEAAIEILKREGKPLHHKDLTRLAIKHNLLSVVGREPEVAMEARLQEELKRATTELVRVSPGVFGLRSFPKRPTGEARSVPRKKQETTRVETAEEGTAQKRRPRKSEEAAGAPAAAPPAEAARVAEVPAAGEGAQRRKRGGRGHAPPPRGEAAQGAEGTAGAGQHDLRLEEDRPQPSAPAAAAPAPAPRPAEPPAEPPPPAPSAAATGPAPGAPSAQTPTIAATGEKPAQPEKGEPPPRIMAVADAVADVLRGSSEGRPVHFRQITDIALKRRLVRGEATDLWRLLRAGVVRDQRQRDSDGLRARVRNLGQGTYGLGERKLEPELVTAEKELTDRLSRTREATRVALRRRLKAMPASAFELLMRLLLERLGLVAADLIKRGEGVAYFAATQSRGARIIRTLVAIRPGEAECSKEAVGELRAGLRQRGFDEGLLLCSGRASPAAVAEANAAAGIDLYDLEPLADLCIRHQIGVRRQLIPMDYLDLDIFAELLEPV